MIGMTLFIVVSVVYPNELRLRPAGFDHDDIFTRLIINLYRTDNPTNVAPSIHVYNSLAIAGGCSGMVISQKVFACEFTRRQVA